LAATLLGVGLVVTACATSAAHVSRSGGPDYAAAATIARDEWGVPWITASDDNAAAYALAYAMAEDGFSAVEDVYMEALGTASRYYGETRLNGDLIRRRGGAVRNARMEYDGASQDDRAFCDAFAQGLNAYVKNHPGVVRQITRFDGWMVMAVVEDAWMEAVEQATEHGLDDEASSSLMWSFGSQKSGDGPLTLVQGWESHPYEADIRTTAGSILHGIAALGSPVMHDGFSQRAAYASVTSTRGALKRVLIAVDSSSYSVLPPAPDATNAGAATAPAGRAHVRPDTLEVNTVNGVQPLVVRTIETDIGDVVEMRADTAVILVTSAHPVQQLARMRSIAHARDSASFHGALAIGASNATTLFVDSTGALLIATGSDIGAGRASGFVGFAPTRAHAAAEVLGTDSAWTIQRLIRASFDTRVFSAPAEIRLLADEWEQVGARSPERAAGVDSALNILRAWNGVSTVASPAMSLFTAYHDEVLRSTDVAFAHFTAMENVIRDARRYPPRPWGSVNAVRRSSFVGSGPEARSVSVMPLAGAPARNDIMFSYDVGNDGQHYVWVADLRSGYGGFVMSFGEGADPRSAHWFDQATLFAAGSLRTVVLSGPPPAAGYHPGAAVPGVSH
jgi:hypothetical protein